MPEDPQQPHYPDVQVQLSGEDGNAFAILGRTQPADLAVALRWRAASDLVPAAGSMALIHERLGAMARSRCVVALDAPAGRRRLSHHRW
jgi:hypothetical protein